MPLPPPVDRLPSAPPRGGGERERQGRRGGGGGGREGGGGGGGAPRPAAQHLQQPLLHQQQHEHHHHHDDDDEGSSLYTSSTPAVPLSTSLSSSPRSQSLPQPLLRQQQAHRPHQLQLLQRLYQQHHQQHLHDHQQSLLLHVPDSHLQQELQVPDSHHEMATTGGATATTMTPQQQHRRPSREASRIANAQPAPTDSPAPSTSRQHPRRQRSLDASLQAPPPPPPPSPPAAYLLSADFAVHPAVRTALDGLYDHLDATVEPRGTGLLEQAKIVAMARLMDHSQKDLFVDSIFTIKLFTLLNIPFLLSPPAIPPLLPNTEYTMLPPRASLNLTPIDAPASTYRPVLLRPGFRRFFFLGLLIEPQLSMTRLRAACAAAEVAFPAAVALCEEGTTADPNSTALAMVGAVELSTFMLGPPRGGSGRAAAVPVGGLSVSGGGGSPRSAFSLPSSAGASPTPSVRSSVSSSQSGTGAAASAAAAAESAGAIADMVLSSTMDQMGMAFKPRADGAAGGAFAKDLAVERVERQ
ncbi:hypothetical protein DFJ73DRAFT_793464 [Zopfochytrium polystomum]|nr:hypothetical protein DFJ73DRAFT_793464 [Zopfochytrium polystomum]